jgi:hypothetical protein
MAKKIKNQYHIGNYILCIDKTSSHSWLRIQSVSSTWVLRFRDDDVMAVKLLDMLNDSQYHSILEAHINMMYTICHNRYDSDFMIDFAKAHIELSERQQRLEPEYSQVESDKAVETELKRLEIMGKKDI